MQANDASASNHGPVDEQATIEASLQNIYCRVLMLDQIAPSDNILDVGGNSLPIMRIVSVLRQELGADVSVKDVFQAPTIAQLARLIASRRSPGS